jgi:hypothetical protein
MQIYGGLEVLMTYTIHFPDDFLPNIDIWGSKGFANLEVTYDGARYQLSFVDPANVRMGLESSDPDTLNCFAEPGMVVIQKITEKHIRSAIDQLIKKRFFDTLAPIGIS